MDANSLLMNRFKMQCHKFSGTISKNLGKIKKQLVKEMIYGIQASKDVKLSNISRALMEPIPLINTGDRLSRNLSDEDLTCTINHHIMRLADDKINDTMVINCFHQKCNEQAFIICTHFYFKPDFFILIFLCITKELSVSDSIDCKRLK